MAQIPSISRIVHYWPAKDSPALRVATTPISALITKVHDPEKGEVNLTTWPDGLTVGVPKSHVFMKENAPEGQEYWVWPPMAAAAAAQQAPAS